jgi:hypothetical protein
LLSNGSGPAGPEPFGCRKGSPDIRRRSVRTVAVGLLAVTVSVWAVPVTVHADPPMGRDAGVIVEWNEITERTLVENTQPLFQTILFYGFTTLAKYDAEVTIEGGFEPWSQLPRADAGASPEVAAATAAYRVLSHYFPDSAAR